MQWISEAIKISQFFGFVGILLGIYAYTKSRNMWTVVASLLCAVGFLAPFFGTNVPLYQILYPHSYHGVVISFLLTLGPWFYLLPFTVPASTKARRKPKGRR
ncbi:MAG: hypothetical protein ACOY93_15985 [Bacillota bacterium]